MKTDVRKIGLNYGVHFEKQKPTGTAAAYLVAHTSYTYLLDAEGRWRMVFPFKTPPESVAADIRQVLSRFRKPCYSAESNSKGRTQGLALPVRPSQSCLRESNPKPITYEAIALPIELRQRRNVRDATTP